MPRFPPKEAEIADFFGFFEILAHFWKMFLGENIVFWIETAFTRQSNTHGVGKWWVKTGGKGAKLHGFGSFRRDFTRKRREKDRKRAALCA